MTDTGARRGRPRSVEADASILDAVTALIAERGYDGLTVEGVAHRAGVAKTTVYRRWPAKADLVVAAMGQRTQDLVIADEGSLRGDLGALLRSLITQLLSSDFGALLRAMPLALAERPELVEAAATGFLADRRRDVDVIIDRAIARGELRPGTDREIGFDLLVGAVFMRFLVTHQPLSLPLADRLVDTVLLGYPNAEG